MDRRQFLVAAAALPVLPTPAPTKELVLDYLDHTRPDLYRTVVLVPTTGQPQPIDHYKGWDMLMEVKRAWILPDDRLEIEKYCIEKGVDAQGRTTFTVKEAQLLTGGWAPATETQILDTWRLVTVNQMGEPINDRTHFARDFRSVPRVTGSGG